MSPHGSLSDLLPPQYNIAEHPDLQQHDPEMEKEDEEEKKKECLSLQGVMTATATALFERIPNVD